MNDMNTSAYVLTLLSWLPSSPRAKPLFAKLDTDYFTGQFVTWLRFPSLSASVSGLAPVLDFTAGLDFLVSVDDHNF
jgi:hypothetical protein